MKYDVMEENYDLVEVLGEKMLFTCNRIEPKTIPPELHVWEVRHDDDCMGIPCQIADWIWVNHWGTLISKNNVPMEMNTNMNKRYRDIDYASDWHDTGESCTLGQYMRGH